MTQAPATLPASAVFAVSPLISPVSETAAVLCPASTCAESNRASLGPASALTAPALAPTRLDSDSLLAVTRATASTIQSAPCLEFFLAGKQLPTLPPPPSTANHPVLPLLKKYAELGCPADVGLAWILTTIIAAIATGPHASTLTPEYTPFFQQEQLERAQRGFRIVLLADVWQPHPHLSPCFRGPSEQKTPPAL